MTNKTHNVGLNSLCREILSSVTIVFYDKVRGRNKAQRWLLLVCWGFFIWKRYNWTHFHRTILWLTLKHDIHKKYEHCNCLDYNSSFEFTLNITIFPYGEFWRTMMTMHTQRPEIKQYVLHIICSMIRMSNFRFSVLLYTMYDIVVKICVCMIFIDQWGNLTEQSVLIVFSLKQLSV